MKVRSDWFTSVRVRRLSEILVDVAFLPPDITERETETLLWRKCGGPLSEIRSLIDVLVGLKVVRVSGQALTRTQVGHKIAKTTRSRNQDLLALTLIRAGYFHDQAHILLESGEIDADGNLRCPSRFARTGAPQLLGILESWEGVQLFPEVCIPYRILQELNSVWALLPPPIEIPKWASERKEVGDRAEMYTVQYERTRLGPSIFWVARDSDTLGWDVEDRSVMPHRCIEVKGRRDSDVVFYLSENEWNKAQALGANYEVQFWGGIDLAVDPATEYSVLRANGYPLIINNLSAQIGHSWQAVAVSWRISPIPLRASD
jgi:Domain of unknown function (DUF3883)